MGLKKETEVLLTKAEKVFDSSWEVLIKMKRQNFDKGEEISLIEFQSHLANILFSIEKFRNKIIKEEKRIIKNKKQYDNDWFVQRLKSLKNYKQSLEIVTSIGKAIGDAFAYWFYRWDLDLLEEHKEHQLIKSFPTGIGGIGEIEFTEKIKLLDKNKLVIYHGTTNILRIGDISLFDLEKMQIVALGELKTEKIGTNEISINLILTSPKSRNIFDVKKVGKAQPLEYFDKARLERQLKSISKALSIYSPKEDEKRLNIKKDLFDRFNSKELEELYKTSKRNKLSSLKVSEGLVFAGIKNNSKTFKNKFLAIEKYTAKENDHDQIVEVVKQTLKNNSENNGIIISELLYNKNNEVNSAKGTVPIFWLPISEGLLKDLYFKSFFVVVLFNPVHLIDKLMEKEIQLKSKYYKTIDTEKSNKNGQLRVERFDSFIPYITNHLQTENSIIESIEVVQNKIKGEKIKHNMRFDFKIQQIIFDNYKKPNR